MAIHKYASTNLYGYGFLENRSYSPLVFKFLSKISISYRGEYHIAQFDLQLAPIVLKRKNYSGKLSDIEQPLFLVEDDGIWKEYFSGTEVKYVAPPPSSYIYRYSEYVLNNSYDIDNDREKRGAREFIVAELKMMEPKDFANAIKEYKDSEIKCMVGQFLTLKNRAELWGREFDNLVKEIKNARDLKNEKSNLDLAGGMGKYSNVQPNVTSGSNPFSNNSIGSHQNKKESQPGMDKFKNAFLFVAVLLVLVVIGYLFGSHI